MALTKTVPMAPKVLALLAAIFAVMPVAAEEAVQIDYRGLRLNGVLAEAADSDRPVFLLLHGTMAHGEMEIIRALRETLLEQGFSSLSITLSLGVDDRSDMFDCAEIHRHLHTDALDELDAWRKWLMEKGFRRQILLGHSRGGNQVAWYLAERRPESVAAAVLVAPQLWGRDAAAAAYQKRFGTPLAPLLAQAGQADSDALLRDLGFVYCDDATVTAGAFLSYHAPDERMHTPGLVGEIGPPVLVIAASEDQSVPGVAAAMQAAGVENVVEIEGADHFFRDLYTYDVVDAIAAFLDENGI